MNITATISQLMAIIGALVALTNITVQVIKQAIPNSKFPTNFVAVVVALVFTVVAYFAWAAWSGTIVVWYHVVSAVVIGILVAYAAMFGYDKLCEALAKMKQ